MPTIDRAGERYWSSQWERAAVYKPFDVESGSLLTHMNRRFDGLFTEFLGPLQGTGAGLVEIGCARSEYLPYFGRRFGFKLHGLDYSAPGCAQAEAALAAAGIAGEIRQADLYEPPHDWLGRFDVVTSWGLVEHFGDTAAAMRALAIFAKPGGLVVTVVPNMKGAVGLLQKWLNRPVFEVHEAVTPGRLLAATRAAALEPLFNAYFGVSNFWVVNLVGLDEATFGYRVKRLLLRAACAGSVALWAVERGLGPLPATQALAPSVVSIARRG